MTLTEREAATLRAALHCWQNELSYYTAEELRSYYPDLQGIELRSFVLTTPTSRVSNH